MLVGKCVDLDYRDGQPGPRSTGLTSCKSSSLSDDLTLHDVLLQVAVLTKVKHVNIIEYIEHYDSDGVLYIVMEYADGVRPGNRNQGAEDNRQRPMVVSI